MLRKWEIDWFYQEGASALFPDRWEQYVAPIPQRERGDLLRAFHRRLTGRNRAWQLEAARAWSVWEAATSLLRTDESQIRKWGDAAFATAIARIECHYFVNNGFLEQEDQLLRGVRRIRHIPRGHRPGPLRRCLSDAHRMGPAPRLARGRLPPGRRCGTLRTSSPASRTSSSRPPIVSPADKPPPNRVSRRNQLAASQFPGAGQRARVGRKPTWNAITVAGSNGLTRSGLMSHLGATRAYAFNTRRARGKEIEHGHSGWGVIDEWVCRQESGWDATSFVSRSARTAASIEPSTGQAPSRNSSATSFPSPRSPPAAATSTCGTCCAGSGASQPDADSGPSALFQRELFGIDAPLARVVDYFSAAAGSDVGRLLLLLGRRRAASPRWPYS